ncbi:MAG: V4R domain-containing protein [Nitrososphaerales archaeon]
MVLASKDEIIFVRSATKPGRIEDPFLKLRVMVIDEEFYKALASKLYSSFQSGASVILYDMGLGYGELMGRNMKEMGVSRFEVIKDFIELGKSHGYGVFNTPFLKMILSGIRGEPAVRLEDSFFATSFGKTGKVECYLMAGIIAGASQVLLNKKFTCVEEKCLAKGDAYCEFKLRNVS